LFKGAARRTVQANKSKRFNKGVAAMSNAQPEPSMEEILASIRRIISEEDEDAAPSAGPAVAPRPMPVEAVKASPIQSAPAPRAAEEVRPEFNTKTEDIEMIKKSVAEAFEEEGDVILDETAAAAASKAFQSLSQNVRVSTPEGEGRTLEDIVVAMLKPMVKDWLDANLPAIVEEKVEEEVQRLARRRR